MNSLPLNINISIFLSLKSKKLYLVNQGQFYERMSISSLFKLNFLTTKFHEPFKAGSLYSSLQNHFPVKHFVEALFPSKIR
jgi:hypothetical protein